LLFESPGNGPHRFRSHANIGRNLRRRLPCVELTQDRSAPQHPRRFTPLGQHQGELPPILLS
jgi:hypothetical protein